MLFVSNNHSIVICTMYSSEGMCASLARYTAFLAGTRPISTPWLNTLLYFHLVPINLIISQGT